MPKRSGCLASEIPANLPCRARHYDLIGLLVGPAARNADRAVLVDFRRFPAVIQASCALPGWQGATKGE